MSQEISDQLTRPWAIRRWCLYVSISLAIVAECAAIGTWACAFASGNSNATWLLILPFGWPVYYAILYGICYGIAVIDQGGSVMSRRPQWYQDMFPPFARELLNRFYTVSPNIALLIFPSVMAMMAAVALWIAASGRLNP